MNEQEATVTTVIHTSCERVWEALLQPGSAALFMIGGGFRTDWKEGGPITWMRHEAGREVVDHGTVLAVREPEQLRYSHTDSTDGVEKIVSLELKEVAGSTHVRVTQLGHVTGAAREAAEESWRAMLDGLKRRLGEAPVAPPEEPRV